jgi:hypothetical protein
VEDANRPGTRRWVERGMVNAYNPPTPSHTNTTHQTQTLLRLPTNCARTAAAAAAGEDLIEAVEREVMEETGVEVKFDCVVAMRQVGGSHTCSLQCMQRLALCGCAAHIQWLAI